MQTKYLFLLSLFFCRVLADVAFSQPVSGKTYSASGGSASVTIEWVDDDSDSSDDFSLDNVESYTISLCAGETNVECFYTLAKDETISSMKYDASIPDTVAEDGYYFFQLYSVFAAGTTIHYTNRFKLTGMTGSATLTVPVTYSGTVQPAAQTSETGGATINSASFSITYTLQTGKTRYAPMQTQPGSKISHSTWSRRYATSSYSVFTSFYGSAVVDSTITAGWDYTVTSTYNYATPAPYPTKWYAASERVTQASLSSASKKKRWVD